MTDKSKGTDRTKVSAAEEWDAEFKGAEFKGKVGLQRSKPSPSSAVAESEDFSDLEISSDFQPIKSMAKEAPDDYEIAMTGPAAFMDPAPKKIRNDNDEQQSPVAELAASIEQVDENVVVAESKPRRNKLPVFAAVAASVGCLAVLGAYSWPTATASNNVEVGSSVSSITQPKPFAIAVESLTGSQESGDQRVALSQDQNSLFSLPTNVTGDDTAKGVETHAGIAVPTNSGSVRTDDIVAQPVDVQPVVEAPTQLASVVPKAEFVPLKSGISTASKDVEGLSRSDCAARFKTVSLSGSINFESGSATLLRSSRPILNFFAAVFTHCRQFTVSVAGHTDSKGNARFNQKLSEDRAASVAQYLVEIGVPSRNLRVVGYGETKPLASNDTELKRSRNRRIEFTVADG